MKHLVLFAFVALALAIPAQAQLPRLVEGLQNPHMIAGASYSTSNDLPPGAQKWDLFLTLNLPLFRIPSTPCALLGVGLTGGDLGPPYDEFEWGASIPLVTCSFGEGSQLAIQGGWTTAFVGDPNPTGYYAGLGFSLTDSAALAAKRAKKKAEKEAKRAAQLAHLAPTKE